jgi:hypothetical protein
MTRGNHRICPRVAGTGSFWRLPYVKTSVRATRSGTVRYLQLAHNEWDQDEQRSRTKVLYNFGREDEPDKDAVRRLVTALSRLLDPAEALAAAEPGELSVTASRPAGGIHVLDQLWRRLGLGAAVRRPLAGRRLSPETERVLGVSGRPRFGPLATRNSRLVTVTVRGRRPLSSSTASWTLCPGSAGR